MLRAPLLAVVLTILASPASAGRDDHKPCPATWDQAFAYASANPPSDAPAIPGTQRYSGNKKVLLGFPVSYFLIKTLSASEKKSFAVREQGTLFIGLQGDPRAIKNAVWSANGLECEGDRCGWYPATSASQGRLRLMTIEYRPDRAMVRCEYASVI